jgi:hypothetical protein
MRIVRAEFRWGGEAIRAVAPGPPQNRGLHKIQVFFMAKSVQVIIARLRSRDR